MPGKTYSSLLFHIVFSTKERQPLLQPERLRQLADYVGGTVRNLRGVLLQLGGVADHVHLLVSLPPALAVSRAVKEIKGGSSHWLNENFFAGGFRWQAGYAVFSVSRSNLEAVRKYVRSQPEHHLERTLDEELSALQRRHALPAIFDEGGQA